MPTEPLVDQLSVTHRLALAYAPGFARPATLGLLALDNRLAGIVRGAREPLLGQIRLAWWRDRLSDDFANWPAGEPLLALVRQWGDQAKALVALVDGWEAMIGDPPLPVQTLERLALARGKAFGSLAMVVGGDPGESERAGRSWALVDLSGKLGDPQEREAARALAAGEDWRRLRLPRSMRPLAVLHGLAARAMRRGDSHLLAGGGAAMAALRLGLLGR